jgi:hypothetical protein
LLCGFLGLNRPVIILLLLLSPSFLIVVTPQHLESVAADKGGELAKDEVWSGEISVTGHVVVPEGIKLTIEPGTIVKFVHYRGYKEPWKKLGLHVAGIIKALGTPQNQIWFTSDANDPINGDWQGIDLHGTKDSEFNYVIVEFAEFGIAQFDSAASVSNSIIRWSNSEGLYAERSSPVFKFNTLYGNGYHEIALEQYNKDVQILYNVIKDGHFGVHCEETEARIEGNYFSNEKYEAITAGMESQLVIVRNRFDRIGENPISVDRDATASIENNDFGQGTVAIPNFDYKDTKHFDLGYVPGDPQDNYLYIFPDVDETRRTVSKIGEGLSFGWALVYARDALWKFSLGSGEVGKSLDFIGINPTTGSFQKYGNDEVMNPRGLAFDGEHFWVNDFSLLKIYKFDLQGNSIQILDSFDIPEKNKGGTAGLTTDGNYLYLRSRDGSKLYKLDKHGNLLGELRFADGSTVQGALVWTGNYFWTAGGCAKALCKWTRDLELTGEIYPPAKDTWALAWDGKYLWSIQRTCEMWNDAKIYKIEILDDTLTNTARLTTITSATAQTSLSVSVSSASTAQQETIPVSFFRPFDLATLLLNPTYLALVILGTAVMLLVVVAIRRRRLAL